MQFVDVKNDVAFRKIFGNENKTEIIISFLNAILELPKGKLIKHVKIDNSYQFPKIKGLKSSILDVRVTDERNISYIVEMQVEESDGFDKRVQYYTAKQYSGQINKGEDYPKLNQVIFIGILDFIFFEDDSNYITRHRTVNVRTQKSTLNGMEYNFIELAKFEKKLEDIKTLTDKWIYFIKNSSNLEIIPSHVEDKGLKHAYEDAAKYSWTKEELHDYDYASMRKQDERGIMELAVKRAEKKGLEKGKQQGLEEGEKKGMEKGRQENEIEMIIRMIKKDLPIEIIMTVTKLDKKIIEKLLNKYKNK